MQKAWKIFDQPCKNPLDKASMKIKTYPATASMAVFKVKVSRA
jgi:hypothetical protein